MKTENGGFRVNFTRDFPPACGNNFISSPFLDFSTCVRDFPPGCGPNAPKITQIPGSGLGAKVRPSVLKGPTKSGLVSEGLGGKIRQQQYPSALMGPSKSGLVKSGGLVGKVGQQQYPGVLKGPTKSGLIKSGCLGVKMRQQQQHYPSGSKGPALKLVEPMKSKTSEVIESKEREKVLKMLEMFRKRCDELSRKGVKRVDIEANRELSREGKIMKQASLVFGSIPGVEVGDKFYYRVELVIVGLHRLFQGGIDSMEYGGERFATCIVANEGHLDKMGDPNMLSYIGEGGNLKRHEVGVPPDQPLIAGNLALNNSRKSERPVRVVRGLRYGSGNAKIVYVYDGLYTVTQTVQKKGPQGNMVFEFQMTRNPGQPLVPWKEYRRLY